ncbi:MAG: cell division protein FtsW [Alphaproteobacteria bacterium]|nr:MAG: cell division protein FtsW [Alphaproteobacteria bacterium]
MKFKLTRTDRSAISEWAWTIDRTVLGGIMLLIGAGLFLGFAASPPVADRLGLDTFHFVKRQAIFLAPAVAMLLFLSALPIVWIKRIGFAVCAGAMVLVFATFFLSPEIKGATRWIYVGPLSLQPSEFLKPGFVIVTAAILAQANPANRWPAFLAAGLLFAVCAAMLVMQPDFGQTFLLAAAFSVLLFLGGLPRVLIGVGAFLCGAGSIIAYQTVPHVKSRIDRFINPDSGDTYQVDRALDAFQYGGAFGRGLGEGEVKRILPDAHTDFIFAVTAEELGLFACLILLALFAGIVLRGIYRAMDATDPFIQLSVTGLITLFGMQSVVNMAVNLSLMPAKGMTLPFVSYGGSSLLALAITMGMVLALTRTNVSNASSRTPSSVRVRAVTV